MIRRPPRSTLFPYNDALPISVVAIVELAHGSYGAKKRRRPRVAASLLRAGRFAITDIDRKSTRLNSSHSQISYAVFCLKKKTPDSAHESCSPHRQFSPHDVYT